MSSFLGFMHVSKICQNSMFIGSIIALTLSLTLLGFLIVLIIVQRVRANKAAANAAAALGTESNIYSRETSTPAGHVITSNFVAPGATPPANFPSRPNVVGKPIL